MDQWLNQRVADGHGFAAARIAAIAWAALFLFPACGGRIARPVEESSDIDVNLSCSHLAAEYRVNLKRIDDLVGERAGKLDDNIGWLLMMPAFIDLSVAERSEIMALEDRNSNLVALAGNKGCEPFTPAIAPGGAPSLSITEGKIG